MEELVCRRRCTASKDPSDRVRDHLGEDGPFEYMVRWRGFRLHTWEKEQAISERRPDLLLKFYTVQKMCNPHACNKFRETVKAVLNRDIINYENTRGAETETCVFKPLPGMSNPYSLCASVAGFAPPRGRTKTRGDLQIVPMNYKEPEEQKKTKNMKKLGKTKTVAKEDASSNNDNGVAQTKKGTGRAKGENRNTTETPGSTTTKHNQYVAGGRSKPKKNIGKQKKKSKDTSTSGRNARTNSETRKKKNTKKRKVERDSNGKGSGKGSETSGKHLLHKCIPQGSNSNPLSAPSPPTKIEPPVKVKIENSGRSKKGDRPRSKFELGTRMCKMFPGHGVFYGKVIGCEIEEGTGRLLYCIRYDDGDEEDLYEKELAPLVRKFGKTRKIERDSEPKITKTILTEPKSSVSSVPLAKCRVNDKGDFVEEGRCIECSSKFEPKSQNSKSPALWLCGECYRKHARLNKNMSRMKLPVAWLAEKSGDSEGAKGRKRQRKRRDSVGHAQPPKKKKSCLVVSILQLDIRQLRRQIRIRRCNLTQLEESLPRVIKSIQEKENLVKEMEKELKRNRVTKTQKSEREETNLARLLAIRKRSLASSQKKWKQNVDESKELRSQISSLEQRIKELESPAKNLVGC